ncbi:hypothetical protein QBC47DRAFT_132890 [Echria macrotheca]|uniref:Uncharacterized protein n=1 Tax=Echria macrotheca TaxID=438768 RepID=A0AAJ0BJ15_9PEZI|nr:hypothetical protein QBC47DRAFT_132890 [Echria macrotheca]
MVTSFFIQTSADPSSSPFSTSQPVDVPASGLVRLAKWSIQLRELLHDREFRDRAGPITLVPQPDQDIDVDAIKYVLETLCGFTRTRPQSIPIDRLSRRCNALWYYGCDPAAFSGLWERLDKPWEHATGVDWHEYCWRRPPLRIKEDETLKYANAAWVLEKDAVFAQAIQSAVWDSTEDTLSTSVTALKDIKRWRVQYFKRVFSKLVALLTALICADETRAIGVKIQKQLRESRQLGIQLGATEEAWEQNAAMLSRFSIYGFMYQVDLVLLKDTSESSVLPPTGGSSKQDSDTMSVLGPKSVITFNPMRALKRVFGGSYRDEVKKMLEKIDEKIQADQAEFVADRIAERNRILEGWRRWLAQTQPPRERVVQPPGVVAELG